MIFMKLSFWAVFVVYSEKNKYFLGNVKFRKKFDEIAILYSLNIKFIVIMVLLDL